MQICVLAVQNGLKSHSQCKCDGRLSIWGFMKFTATDITGAFVIDLEPRIDERGFFARAWCRDEFSKQGLVTDFVQANIAWTKQKGTLRGLHYQRSPHEEAKVVRCTRGAA